MMASAMGVAAMMGYLHQTGALETSRRMGGRGVRFRLRA
jgi:hypothetical protein